MEKLLITGGSGFIGSNLIEELKHRGKFILLSIDIAKPKMEQHLSIWRQVDIMNKEAT